MDNSGLGDLIVTVGGDLSPLEEAFGTVAERAAAAAKDIDAALSSVNIGTELQSGLDELDLSLKGAGDAAVAVQPNLHGAADAATALGNAAGGATPHIEDLVPPLEHVAEGAHHAESSLVELFKEVGGGILTLEGLKAAAEEAIEAFSKVETARIALTSLTKSAEETDKAIERMEELAKSDGLSFPSLLLAQQKLAFFGLELDKIPPLLQAVAGGATTMGTSLDTAFAMIERMVNTGVIMQRSLTQIGLNIQDIGKAMGQEGATGAEIMKAFKENTDEQTRALIIQSAETEKFGDVEKAFSDDTERSWTRIKNAVHEAWAAIGEALDGFKGLTTVVGTGIKFLEDVALELIGVFKQIANFVVGWGAIMSNAITAVGKAIVDVVHGDFAKANQELLDANTRGAAYWTNFLDSVKKDWHDTGASIGKIWGDTGTAVSEASDKAAVHVDLLGKAHKATKAEVDALKIALNDSQVNLIAVTEAYRKHTATSQDLKDALQAVDAAQAALAEKLPKLGAEHLSAAKAAEAHADAEGLLTAAAAKFVGPVQEGFTHGIEVIAGSHRNAEAAAHAQALGIQMLTATMPKLADSSNAAASATNTLGTAFDNVSTSVGKANALMDAFAAKIKEVDSLEQSFIDFDKNFGKLGVGGTLVTGGGAFSISSTIGGASAGSGTFNAPPPVSGGGGGTTPAPIIQQPTISAADTGQITGLLTQIDSDLQSILATLQNLTVNIGGQVSVTGALNTTTASLNTTLGTVGTATTALSTSVDGLQTVATGLTTGFSQTAQALQTVAVVTAVGTASMLSGIKEVIAVVAPIAQAVSPQMARVPLSQLGVISQQGTVTAGGGVTIPITIQAGTVVGAGGMTELSNIVGSNIVAKLQELGIRVQ